MSSWSDLFPPIKRKGTCAEGHPVETTATKAEIQKGDLFVFCKTCEAYVLPQWEKVEVEFTPTKAEVWISPGDTGEYISLGTVRNIKIKF